MERGGGVIGIDPGTRKCGYAVQRTIGAVPLAIGITSPDDLAATVEALVRAHDLRTIALGAGTHAPEIGARLAGLAGRLDLTIALVDERDTTYLARRRYFAAHPPRGWRRLVPLGMLVPPRPIDDFAALLIAERHLAASGT